MSQMRTLFVISIALLCTHALLVYYTYSVVREPYMDEIFHINQTRAYCSGNYQYWNQKITTPPLTYLLAMIFFCGKERYFNSALVPFCFIGLYRVRRLCIPQAGHFDSVVTALIAISLPVLFDTSILFYTDLLSLTTVILGFSCKNQNVAVIFFALGVLTRQTNIIWAALYCFRSLLKRISENFSREKPFSSLFLEIIRHFSFVVLGFLFIIFIIANKGVVLGDRTAHQPTFHIPQFFYCVTFISLSSSPIFFTRLCNTSFKKIGANKVLSLIMMCLAFLSVKYFTYAHQYLISDNRHFTFYVWRWWFEKGWYFKYLNIPLYLPSLFSVFSLMNSSTKDKLLFLCSTALVIIPSQLLEFRYFIIPYVLWRLTIVERRYFVLICELLQNLVITAVALYLFFQKPFVWQSEPNIKQRFMW